MLKCLAAHVNFLHDRVHDGSDAARTAMRKTLLEVPRATFSAADLDSGSYEFERLGYLLGDLAAPKYLSVFLPQDRPGSLRALLQIFEAHAVNLDSIQSSRTSAGEVHFRIGLARDTLTTAIVAVAGAIDTMQVGRVLARAD